MAVRKGVIELSEFLYYVLSQLRSSLLFVALAAIVSLGVVYIIYRRYRRQYGTQKQFPWRKAMGWFVFAGYCAILFYATFLRSSGHFREWNFHWFRAWREAWNNFSVKNWANILLNIALFVPLGFLLPLLTKKLRRWHRMTAVGFGVSLAIELIQLLTARGICDVDDLFANTLGAAMGYFAADFLCSIVAPRGHRLKPALRDFGILCLPVLAIGSIFAAYRMQEFGNLPNAAAYSNNTRKVQWTLACEFPSAESEVACYQTQAMSRGDCDALAQQIASLVGEEVDMASYYQEMAYYNLTGGIVTVYYYDGSLRASFHDHGTFCSDLNREMVEHKLEQFPVQIPEQAEFDVQEDGWYSFTCDRLQDGAVLLDGALRCRFNEDGTLCNIENNLVWYRFHRNVAILSPEQAYKALCAGEFYDNGLFEYKSPTQISVLSCILDYEIDTKGFYQPVYRFSVASSDGSYEDSLMIPALP